jgi:glycosyltransferase involved in cell wall biosynthesis
MEISVVIPAFNAGKTLLETLQGVIAQSRPADEIILLDDGSTDATSSIAAGLPGVRVLRQDNAGIGAAMRNGVAAATHPYIAMLDADDVWSPDCLATHVACLEHSPGLDASVGWVTEFICPSLDAATAVRFLPRPTQVGWLSGTTMFRRAAYLRAGEFNAQLHGGVWIDWVDRAKQAGVSFGVINYVLLLRRLHPGSFSTNRATSNGKGLTDAVRLAIARRRRSPT